MAGCQDGRRAGKLAGWLADRLAGWQAGLLAGGPSRRPLKVSLNAPLNVLPLMCFPSFVLQGARHNNNN